jgi:DNA-binding response OmpR family regulator
MARILLVDDEPNILKLSSFIVKSLGYEVFTAENGKKALDFLKNNTVDLVVSDLIMPEIGGFDLCEQLRDKTPVIIVSAMSDEFKPETIFKVGAVDYIPKPFDVSYMRQRLPVILHKIGVNKEYASELVTTIKGQPIYKGENVLVIGGSRDQIQFTGPVMDVTAATCDFASIVKNSELAGQTIQSRAGGLRIVHGIDLDKNIDLVKMLNRTNCAVGDCAGIYLSATEPGPVLELFDRVIR